jgi:hypothetical protein
MKAVTLALLALTLAAATTAQAVDKSSSSAPVCVLSRLHATASLQGATGSMLGGVRVSNSGPTCRFAGPPTVELVWHGRQVTPPARSFPRGALRSVTFRPSRLLHRGGSLFIWTQWWNYCGPKLWSKNSFRPVAVVRVRGQAGAVIARFTSAVEPPYCNTPKGSAFFVSDFGFTR